MSISIFGIAITQEMINTAKDLWGLFASILSLLFIPTIKNILTSRHKKKEEVHFNMCELEKMYHNKDAIKNLPKFFQDYRIAKFKEVNCFSFEFFIHLMDKNLGYREIIQLNKTLSSIFPLLKLMEDHQKIGSRGKWETIFINYPRRTKCILFTIFILFISLSIFNIYSTNSIWMTVILILFMVAFEFIVVTLFGSIDDATCKKKYLQSKDLWYKDKIESQKQRG